VCLSQIIAIEAVVDIHHIREPPEGRLAHKEAVGRRGLVEGKAARKDCTQSAGAPVLRRDSHTEGMASAVAGRELADMENNRVPPAVHREPEGEQFRPQLRVERRVQLRVERRVQRQGQMADIRVPSLQAEQLQVQRVGRRQQLDMLAVSGVRQPVAARYLRSNLLEAPLSPFAERNRSLGPWIGI